MHHACVCCTEDFNTFTDKSITVKSYAEEHQLGELRLAMFL